MTPLSLVLMAAMLVGLLWSLKQSDDRDYFETVLAATNLELAAKDAVQGVQLEQSWEREAELLTTCGDSH